jgi:hypothetical protein
MGYTADNDRTKDGHGPLWMCMSKRDKPHGWKMDSLAAHLFGVVCIGTFFVLQRQYPKSVWIVWKFFGLFPFIALAVVQVRLIRNNRRASKQLSSGVSYHIFLYLPGWNSPGFE